MGVYGYAVAQLCCLLFSNIFFVIYSLGTHQPSTINHYPLPITHHLFRLMGSTVFGWCHAKMLLNISAEVVEGSELHLVGYLRE